MDVIVSQLVIVFVLSLIAGLFTRTSSKIAGHFKLLLGLSAVGYIITILMGLATSFVPIDYQLLYIRVKDWIMMISIILMLCGLGVMIRYSKPKITRAPVILSYLPVLLLFVHPFVVDTIILKSVLINFYHGGGLLIALMMYTIKSLDNPKYYAVLVGVVIISVGYILNFFDWNMVAISNLVVSTGLIIVYNGYKQIDINLEL
jgi:hypothetical protein